jgi:hypothetical protein
MKPYHHQKAHSWDFHMTWLEGMNNTSNNSAPISILQPILNDIEDDEEEEHDPRNLSFSPERTEVISPIRTRGDAKTATPFEPLQLPVLDQHPKRFAPTTSTSPAKHSAFMNVQQSYPAESTVETNLFCAIEAQREKYRNALKRSAFSNFLERLPQNRLVFARAAAESNLDASALTNPTATTTGNTTDAMPTSVSPFSWELDNEQIPVSKHLETQKFILMLIRLQENLAASNTDKEVRNDKGSIRLRPFGVLLAAVSVLLALSLLLDINQPRSTTVVNARENTTSLVWLISLTMNFGLAKAAEFLLQSCLPSQAILQSSEPTVMLLLSQSKGWPALIFFSGVFNLIVFTGLNQVLLHWSFCVKVPNEKVFIGFAVAEIAVGAFGSVKRTLAGLYIAQRLFGT